jgi:hypothetical protein
MTEGYMVRHKQSGEYLHEGMNTRSVKGGKIWRSVGNLNSAISWHTKYLDDPRCPDFVRRPKDYEVVALQEVQRFEMTQWFEWRNQ